LEQFEKEKAEKQKKNFDEKEGKHGKFIDATTGKYAYDKDGKKYASNSY
jgi:VCBS repeat-containing protein